MRSLAIALLCLSGCADSPNRQEFTNSEIAFLQLHARVGELTKQLGMIQAPDLTPLSDRVTALEARATALEAAMAKIQAPKVPHLVSRDTGVDYGISIDGGLAAWDPRFEAVIDYSPPRIIYFDQPDCMGNPYFDLNTDINGKFNRYLFAADGRLVRPIDNKRFNGLAPGSAISLDGTCSGAPGISGFPGLAAAFSTPRAAAETLDVQLR